jgi:elongation factor 1-gamma
MSGLILHGPKDSPRNWKIFIAAKYSGVEIQTLPFVFGEDNKKPEFLAKNPIGKVPVLETPEGYVFESNACARYVALLDKNRTLLGRNILEEAQVEQWTDFTLNELEPNIMTWIGPILGYLDYDKDTHDQAVKNLKRAFDALNRHLETRTYLVGERVSLADVIMASSLASPYKMVFDPKFRSPFPNVNRWFDSMCGQPNFAEVLKFENTSWCVVPQSFKKKAAPRKVEVEDEEEEETTAEEKKEAAPKAAAPKPEAPKKEAPKKKKDEDEEEEEEDVDREEKKKNELDSLPKSTFVIDEFKRFYSNNPLDPALAFLWEKFDNEGWSMWFCDYKYNDELTKVFMTTNLVGGFLQRMDPMRKYSFGQMNIYGPETQQKLTGFWIIRSKEIPKTMSEVDDTELYTWNRIDNIEANKDKIRTYLAKENLDGNEWLDGKTFK